MTITGEALPFSVRDKSKPKCEGVQPAVIRPEINTIRPVKIRSLITGEVVQRNCAPSRDEVTADGAVAVQTH